MPRDAAGRRPRVRARATRRSPRAASRRPRGQPRRARRRRSRRRRRARSSRARPAALSTAAPAPRRRSRSPGSGRSSPGCAGAGRRGRRREIEANASRISPAVTRSQKQTMRPYSGSAAIRVGVLVRAAGTPRRGSASAAAPAVPSRGADVRPARASSPTHVLGDGHARGQPGRADAADQQVALRGVDVDQVVAVVDGGAQPGVGRGDLLVQQPRHQRARPSRAGSRSPPRTCRWRVRSSRSSDVGPEHHVAVDGRADQHALARATSAPAARSCRRAGGPACRRRAARRGAASR